MKFLKLKNYLVCLVVFILFYGSCKEKKKSIDDIMFMTKGCYTKDWVACETELVDVYTFKRISKDILYFKHLIVTPNGRQHYNGVPSVNLKIDESGNNLVGVDSADSQFRIPIPKNENDPIFFDRDSCQKTTNCYVQ